MKADVDAVAKYLRGERTTLDAALRPAADAALRFADGADVEPPTVPLAVADALVALLVERRDTNKLEALAAHGDRDTAKAARRGIHLLRTKGVATAAPRRPVPGPSTPTPTHEEVEAWASPPDGKGERLVSILRASPSGGFDQIHLTLSDEEGLVDVIALQGPRKRFRDLKRRFEERHLVFAQIPFAYGQQLVQEAYDRTIARRRSPPSGYAAARSVIGAPHGEVPHPALTEITPSDTLTIEDGRGLHVLPDLLTWAPDRVVLETLSLRFDEIATSQLLVDDRQRDQARMGAIDQAVEATFETSQRPRWHRRLLDAALVYARAGHEDDAMRLRAEADRVVAPDFVPTEDGFARGLIEKLMAPEMRTGLVTAPGVAEPEQQSGSPSKLIITP